MGGKDDGDGIDGSKHFELDSERTIKIQWEYSTFFVVFVDSIVFYSGHAN